MNLQEMTPKKFSDHFGLNISQDLLEFVDIFINKDVPLFLDPYGISAMNTKWSENCEQHIIVYFQYLIECIQGGDKKKVQRLLNALHEVDEIALGYSSGIPKGRGIGLEQANQLKIAFENSQAAKSGDIRDIADCALLIPGINRDKVSDITANILKKDLILFTQEQCSLHRIPMRKVAVSNAFDFERFEFKSFYTHLPVIKQKAFILLPISSVRREPELSKEKYYRNFIIEYLRAEHTHAGDSLAYVLKNGILKVNITDLKAKYPMTVEFIYKFSKDHPQILERFKSELHRTAKIGGTAPILRTMPRIFTAMERIRLLARLKSGDNDARSFHTLSFDNLKYILGSRISNPKLENPINDGRKRIDIVFNNDDKFGFFHNLNSLNKILCPKIIIECKNYGQELGNPEIDQLQGRLNHRRGMFGIIICRSIQNRKRMIQRCKDVMNDSKGFIVVLDDSDISILLKLREKMDDIGIDNFLSKKFDELIM